MKQILGEVGDMRTNYIIGRSYSVEEQTNSKAKIFPGRKSSGGIDL